MTKIEKNTLYICLLLGVLVFIDLGLIGGILLKAHANFTEVYKNLTP
jgi:hypothetical protein